MSENPLLKKLGLGPKDRAVIVHVDDVGMCHSSVEAFAELVDHGTTTSGAIMAPCPWFEEALAYGRKHPEADLGVHATLTSEWDGYRWGPVSTRSPASGLLDAEGYFPKTCEEVRASGRARAATRELAAQADRIVAGGVDPTHIDTHMGSVANRKFMKGYLAQAFRLKIPAMLPRPDAIGFETMVPNPDERKELGAFLSSLEKRGLPLLDGILSMPLDEPGDQLETAKRLLRLAPAGVTHFIMHASVDSPELRAITPDWESRVSNYRCFMSKELKAFIKDEGLVLIGYRALRDAMRAAR